MHTGQNCSSLENSLPQTEQVRLFSTFMGLAVLPMQSEPETKPRPTDWCDIGQHDPLANCCLVPQTFVCSFTLARQFRFRNKIPTAGGLRRPPVDNDLRPWGAGSKLTSLNSVPLDLNNFPCSRLPQAWFRYT
jgi:hypothetical protein